MARRAVVAVLVVVVAGVTGGAGAAGARTRTQTLVFDEVWRGSFVDLPPAGPSPGDTELSAGTLRDATGHVVGSAHDHCVFTKVIPNDVLERCSGTARTSDGSVALAGVGHLNSMNPPWRVVGLSGAYKGLQGEMVFATDIPLDPNVPLAAGRGFSVSVITVNTSRPLRAGVVPRPQADTAFIGRANAACQAAEAKGMALASFPFASFDPFHPDPNLLPQVGRFFDQPARRRLPRQLIGELEKLGQPPAGSGTWKSVLAARRAVLSNETRQVNAALANNASAFVTTVYNQARVYNQLVFRSAVFGVEACTFS
jgi:hypothetical protein